jgi:hypothetical protein
VAEDWGEAAGDWKNHLPRCRPTQDDVKVSVPGKIATRVPESHGTCDEILADLSGRGRAGAHQVCSGGTKQELAAGCGYSRRFHDVCGMDKGLRIATGGAGHDPNHGHGHSHTAPNGSAASSSSVEVSSKEGGQVTQEGGKRVSGCVRPSEERCSSMERHKPTVYDGLGDIEKTGQRRC